MAVTTRKNQGGKTNVYWTKDSDDRDNGIVKVHVPGVNLEPSLDIKKPMVKKPVKPRRPDLMMIPKRSRIESLKYLKAQKTQTLKVNGDKRIQDIDDVPVKDVSDTCSKAELEAPAKVALKDLRPEDKKRVANLVKELAKVGEERELALSQLTEERMAFEERLHILQEEYDSNINEKLNLQKRFLELQELLKKYKEEERSKVKKSKKSQSSNTTQTSPSTNSLGKQLQKSLTESPGNDRTKSPQRENTIANKSKRQSTPVASTSLILDNAKQVEFSEPKTIFKRTSPDTREQLHTSQTDTLQHEKAKEHESVSKESPVIRKFARPRHEGADLPVRSEAAQHFTGSIPVTVRPSTAEQQSLQAMTSTQGAHERTQRGHNQSLLHQPPPKSTEQEPPVYANKIFDMSVLRPNAGRPFAPPFIDANNRSQSDTSQTFSAELDAVYRLYCREYELQLQLQQQQLELQKQQLQLQQQLQQLELFQQRQQSQQQTLTAHVKQPQPSTPAKPIIRETPIPTPAPQPSAQPRQESPLDGLVPTPIESEYSQPQHSASIKNEDKGQRDTPTIRRITSSKRPQKSERTPFHDGSNQSHPPSLLQAVYADRDASKHSSQQPQLIRGSVNKEIIQPDEADQFKFSLYRNHSATKSTIDWSTASDLEFRRMQESRIREHYGLTQYPLHSTQASLGERLTSRTSDYLYERPRITEIPSERNGREVDGIIHFGQQPNGRHPYANTSRANYDFYERSRIAEEPPKRDGRKVDGIIYSGEKELVHEANQDFHNENQTTSNQQYSLYTSRNQARYSGHNHFDKEEVVEPWVSRTSSQQRDRSAFEQVPELNYPLQIVDLVHEMEDEPTITSPSRKPNYAFYPSSHPTEPVVLDGILDSTDSGYSQVSRGIYEDKRSALYSVCSDNEADDEELNVLEDIFFI